MGSGATTLGPAIHSEVGGILRNEQKLFDSFGHELFGFTPDRFDRAAAMFSAHLRNDAKGAGMVTTLGNLYIGKMFRG